MFDGGDGYIHLFSVEGLNLNTDSDVYKKVFCSYTKEKPEGFSDSIESVDPNVGDYCAMDGYSYIIGNKNIGYLETANVKMIDTDSNSGPAIDVGSKAAYYKLSSTNYHDDFRVSMYYFKDTDFNEVSTEGDAMEIAYLSDDEDVLGVLIRRESGEENEYHYFFELGHDLLVIEIYFTDEYREEADRLIGTYTDYR